MVVSSGLEMLSLTLLLPVLHLAVTQDSSLPLPSVGAVFARMNIDIASIPLITLVSVLLGIFVVKSGALALFTFYQTFNVAKIRAAMTSRMLEAYSRKSYEETLHVNSSNAVYDIVISAPSIVATILLSFLGMVMELTIAFSMGFVLFTMEPVGSMVVVGVVAAFFGLYYFALRNKVTILGDQMITNNKEISRWSHLCIGIIKENRILKRENYFFGIVGNLSLQQARMSAIIDLITQMPRIFGELIIFSALLGVIVLAVLRDGTLQGALPVLGVFAVAAFRVLPSGNRILNNANTIRRHILPLESVYDDLLTATQTHHQIYESTSGPVVPFKQDLVLKGVSYKYPKTCGWVVSNIDLRVSKGQVIAFVGPSGAGKSTIVDIILGLLPPTSGQILLDDHQVMPGEGIWNGRVGYVPQSIYLADDTLRRNITLGIPDQEVEEDKICRAIEMAQLSPVIATLENGLETVIGERGMRISGGQRQRIGIARALYSNPEVLVLDEATSSLDGETEKSINESILALSGKMTVIIIAHRLSTVKQCDQIFFVREGEIVDSGTFAELKSRHAFFNASTQAAV